MISQSCENPKRERERERETEIEENGTAAATTTATRAKRGANGELERVTGARLSRLFFLFSERVLPSFSFSRIAG